MGLIDIKRELKKLDKNKLVDLVADLYKQNKSVKEFFDFYVQPDEDAAFNKYRDKVFEAFYPKRGDKLKLRDGKQAISDFKKLGPAPELLADLMLFYVETGVKFTNEFGDVNESFYSSLESTYLATLTFMKKEELLKIFADRAHNVVLDTTEIGWGFNDYLCDVFFRFYQKTKEEPVKVIKLGQRR